MHRLRKISAVRYYVFSLKMLSFFTFLLLSIFGGYLTLSFYFFKKHSLSSLATEMQYISSQSNHHFKIIEWIVNSLHDTLQTNPHHQDIGRFLSWLSREKIAHPYTFSWNPAVEDIQMEYFVPFNQKIDGKKIPIFKYRITTKPDTLIFQIAIQARVIDRKPSFSLLEIRLPWRFLNSEVPMFNLKNVILHSHLQDKLYAEIPETPYVLLVKPRTPIDLKSYLKHHALELQCVGGICVFFLSFLLLVLFSSYSYAFSLFRKRLKEKASFLLEKKNKLKQIQLKNQRLSLHLRILKESSQMRECLWQELCQRLRDSVEIFSFSSLLILEEHPENTKNLQTLMRHSLDQFFGKTDIKTVCLQALLDKARLCFAYTISTYQYEITLHCEEEETLIETDPFLCQLLLINLFCQSFDRLPEEGKLDIEIKFSKELVRMTFSDNGYDLSHFRSQQKTHTDTCMHLFCLDPPLFVHLCTSLNAKVITSTPQNMKNKRVNTMTLLIPLVHKRKQTLLEEGRFEEEAPSNLIFFPKPYHSNTQ